MRHFYQVTDFEGYDNYYTSKKKAISVAKKFYKEAINLGYVNPIITLQQFDLPKVPFRELVILLLNNVRFMSNQVSINFLEKKP